MNYPLLFLFLMFFVIPVSADINITVVGENSKDVSILALNQTVENTTINGQTIQLPYENHIVKMIANNSNTLSWSNLWGFTSGTTSRYVFYIIIVFIVFLLWGFMRSL